MKTKPNILIVQFRMEKNKILSEQISFNKALKKTKHRFVSIFNKHTKVFENPEKTLKIYSHVIFGGSSEFGLSKETVHPQEKKYITQRIKKLINTSVKKDHPTLGICFGHHLIAYIRGATIIRANNQRELGKINVIYTKTGKTDKLFTGIKNKFTALTAHIESITKIKSEMNVLASTQRCKVAAFKIKSNIYGVQFHPELDKKDFLERLNMSNKDNDDYKNIYKIGDTETKNILKNFVGF